LKLLAWLGLRLTKKINKKIKTIPPRSYDDLYWNKIRLRSRKESRKLIEFQQCTIPKAFFLNDKLLIDDLNDDSNLLPLNSLWAKNKRYHTFDGNEFSPIFEIKISHHHDNQKGVEIYSVKMPKPQFNIEAFYVVMIIQKNHFNSKRYFTLEYVKKSDSAFLCEVTEQGAHFNYAECPESLSLDDFLQLIKNKINF